MSDFRASVLLLLVIGAGLIAGIVAIGFHLFIGGYGSLFWALAYFATVLAAFLYLCKITLANVQRIPASF